MVKTISIFLAGCLIGMAATVIAVFMFGIGLPDHDEILWFNQDGTCITRANLKVFKTLAPDRALVGEEDDQLLEAPIMLLISDDVPNFYDEQIIKVPQGFCAKHVGNFNYKTKDDGFKTVPVVHIKQ